MTDVNVALDGQPQSEPNGCRVEESRNHFVHDVIGVAGGYRCQWLVVIAERVQVEEPRSREQERQHVGQSHGHEHRVGRCPHVTLGQDQDDQGVGHDGDDQQEGHDVAVKRKGVADVQVGRYVHRPAEVVELYVQPGDVDLLLQVGLHGDRFIGLHLHLSVFRR